MNKNERIAEQMRQEHDLRDRLLPILEYEDPTVALYALLDVFVNVIVHQTDRPKWRETAAEYARTLQVMIDIEEEAATTE
jgi:hypothetical protein